MVSDLKILDWSFFQLLEILLCLYFSSLISLRKVFVLQTELWIPPFKWIMSEPSSMFMVREIKQKLRRIFSGHPVGYWEHLEQIPTVLGDICAVNICPADICPFQEYFSCYWPNFDETLKVGSCERQEQIPTVMVTFVQATFVLATFVHIRNISGVTDPILMKLYR